MKCGTGAVSKFLSQHSGIYDIGETYFFNRYYEKGYSYYDALLTRRSSGKRKIVFEKTPTYYKVIIGHCYTDSDRNLRHCQLRSEFTP